MADKDRVWASTGETAQQAVDRMAGNGQKDGGVKGPMVPTKPAPQNIHPSSPGGRTFGAPIEPTILH